MLWIGIAAAWDVRLELGGQFEAASHGIANVYARNQGLELALITDTLQVRYDHHGSRGRWWAAGRAQLGAVGLVSTRWIDGAPSPEQSQLGFSAGPEGGAVAYLQGGFYLGVQGSLRYYAFAPLPRTVDTAEARPVWVSEVVAGWWSEAADVYVRGGVTWSNGWVPGVHLVGDVHPTGPVAPWIQVHAGIAENTDLVTAVRLGGMNPYVVPLAGAAWAEFWVEDYAAVRVGPRFQAGGHWLAPLVDAAVFDGRSAWGLGTMGHVQVKRFGFDVGAGLAPELKRLDRSWAASWYVRGTLDLGPRR